MKSDPKQLGPAALVAEDDETSEVFQIGDQRIRFSAITVTQRVEYNVEAMQAAVAQAASAAEVERFKSKQQEAIAVQETAKADQLKAKADRARETFAVPQQELTKRTRFNILLGVVCVVAMFVKPELAWQIFALGLGIAGTPEVVALLGTLIGKMREPKD